MDAVACSHPELEIWIGAIISENDHVIVKKHDHDFIVDFKANSFVIPMWTDSCIADDVNGAEEDKCHQLHEWIVMKEGWNGDEDDSSEKGDGPVEL